MLEVLVGFMELSSKRKKTSFQEADASKSLKSICPCCKRPKDCSNNFFRRHIAVAVCAHKPLVAQFLKANIGFNSSFRVCSNCYNQGAAAAEVVSCHFPDIPLFKKQEKCDKRATSSTIDTVFDVEDGNILDMVRDQCSDLFLF
jgi:hypothetical protein